MMICPKNTINVFQWNLSYKTKSRILCSSCDRIQNPWVPKDLFFIYEGGEQNMTLKNKNECKMFQFHPFHREIYISTVLFYCLS